ncbi:MAG TPA: hypothetical protein VF789_30540 [Thermoanaerobaculia bacterium]
MTDLEKVASRLFWWKTPAEALADSNRFLAQVMTYGTIEDLAVVRRHFPESAFREVLANPPAGVFDPRSWAYWHVRFGLEAPELPTRSPGPARSIENDPRFLRRVEEARRELREGKGIRLEDLQE